MCLQEYEVQIGLVSVVELNKLIETYFILFAKKVTLKQLIHTLWSTLTS